MVRAMLSFGWGHAKQPLAVAVLGRAGSRHIPGVSAPLGAWGHEEPREGSRNPAPGGWGVCGHGALLWRGTILYFFPPVEVHVRSGCQTNKRTEAKAPKRQSKQLRSQWAQPARSDDAYTGSLFWIHPGTPVKSVWPDIALCIMWCGCNRLFVAII